ncbi:SDR family NAD(P)-dependent oxidoreductase [Alteromonas flava]|uniref:SDR family NAD(P)-dependent oxidoreductase n=1 Tax=Alteromonas flava TaxID=2048003 RepID=UPI0013D97072|nr:SDR family oxidoreductase [Alteromonas flava]
MPKVALVTGAASGIGLALTEGLLARGYDIAMLDIDESRLIDECERLQAAIKLQGTQRLTPHHCDVADSASIDQAVTNVIAEHGHLDVLINNAGVAVGGAFGQMSEADFNWLININLLGLVHMTRVCLPHLLTRPSGNIVNISSLFGIIAPPGQTAYSASKFAVRGFSKALQHELVETDITVSIVYPGGVRTRIAKQSRKAEGLDAAEYQQGIKEFNRALVLAPEKAAQIILDGMQRGRAEILVGTDAKIIRWLARLFPRHYWPMVEKLMPSGQSLDRIRAFYNKNR